MPVALHDQGTAVLVAQLDRDVEVRHPHLEELGGGEVAKIVPAGLCTPGGGDGAVLGRGCDLPLPIGLVGVQRAFEHVDGLAAGTGDGSALQAIQMAFIVARASGPDGFARPVAIRSLLDPKIGASSKRAVFGMCAKRCDAPSLELPARIRSRATQRAGKASEARSRRAAGVGTSPEGEMSQDAIAR